MNAAYWRSEAFAAFRNRHVGPSARAYARQCITKARVYGKPLPIGPVPGAYYC
jgi:hypothetical protein